MYYLFLSVVGSLAQHGTIRMLAGIRLWEGSNTATSSAGGTATATTPRTSAPFAASVVSGTSLSTALIVSSCMKLFPVLMVVWRYDDVTGLVGRGVSYAVGVQNVEALIVLVNLNIPIFDWFKARNASRQFQARSQQVEANRAISERTFSREYETALARVKQYYALIAATDNQRKLAEEDLMLSRLRYEGGEGSALDVVTSQSQLAQARSNYITNLTNYLNARVDLEVTAGR